MGHASHHSPRAKTERVDADSPVNTAGLPVVSVLIVDDDDDCREMLADRIRKAGYSVATACNGREAIHCLHSVRPQLILLDVAMPVMDGATFRQEQRHHRDWISIPTIVMTGCADEPVLDIAVELALRKPVGTKVLLDLVASHCTK